MALSELDVLFDVARRLDRLGLDYMLTGSMAMSLYATPRMTRDIDVVVAISDSAISDFQSEFADAYYVPDELHDVLIRPGMFNIMHLASGVKVDLIVRKEADFRRTEFARRQQITIGNRRIWVVSKEDLLLSKLLWAADSHSEQQLRDVRNLLGSNCDHAYLLRWAADLGVSSLLEECLHE